MIITIYDVEDGKMIKVEVQQCRPTSVIDTTFELIELNHSYRVRLVDLKNPKKYIVSTDDLVDLILYIDHEFTKRNENE